MVLVFSPLRVGFQYVSDMLALVFYTVDNIRVVFTSCGFVDDYVTLYIHLVILVLIL